MYCPKCGKENKDTAKFCRHCGQPIAAAPDTPYEPAAQQPPMSTPIEPPEPALAQPTQAAAPGGKPQTGRKIPRWLLWVGGVLLALLALWGILVVIFTSAWFHSEPNFYTSDPNPPAAPVAEEMAQPLQEAQPEPAEPDSGPEFTDYDLGFFSMSASPPETAAGLDNCYGGAFDYRTELLDVPHRHMLSRVEQFELEAGQPFVLWDNWLTKEPSFAYDFLTTTEYQILIDGQEVANSSDPGDDPLNGYAGVAFHLLDTDEDGCLDYSVGYSHNIGPLAPGTYQVSAIIHYLSPLSDGYDWDGDGQIDEVPAGTYPYEFTLIVE